MDDFWLVTALGLLVLICLYASGERLRDKKVSVMYGYPAGETTWLTIYHYRSANRWVLEWDDLFDEGRPKSMRPISQCLMFRDKKSGATVEEFVEAELLLRKRGYS